MDSTDHPGAPRAPSSSLTPLGIPVYRNFWIAGLFSNIGTWMHETGAVWIMTEMRPSPDWVSYVRTAMALPVFCLALPAGVWADRFERRRWLLCTQSTLLLMAAAMAVLSFLGWMTPELLLSATFFMGIALILNLPAWQALTPELVPPELIPSAVQAGSVSFNLARSIGPALAGLMIARYGAGAAFLFNAASFLGVLIALLLWRPKAHGGSGGSAPPVVGEVERTKPDCLPESCSSGKRPNSMVGLRRTIFGPEFFRQLMDGLKVIRQSAPLRNTLIRVLLFTFCASALWSLLSLVAIEKLGFRERGFGSCLAMLGLGAVLTAGVMPWMRIQWSSETIVWMAQMVMASQLIVVGAMGTTWIVGAALALSGACWMCTMTTLNATVQVHLQRDYRARGMSAFVMSFALGMALGSATWGWVARATLLDGALATAGLCMVAAAWATHHLALGSLRVAA